MAKHAISMTRAQVAKWAKDNNEWVTGLPTNHVWRICYLFADLCFKNSGTAPIYPEDMDALESDYLSEAVELYDMEQERYRLMGD